ncbi:CheY-like chemotaxis protein [Oxalobacteraceae bacterium GrIS 2.11]
MKTKQQSNFADAALSILLVEDDLINQQLVVVMLTTWGHIVDVANNGSEALSMYEHGKYDLILMDIQMPGIDGLEAARLIRAREMGSEHRAAIVAVSANSIEQSAAMARAVGMDDYFAKPFAIEGFHTLIRKYERKIYLAAKNKINATSHQDVASATPDFDYEAALNQVDPSAVSIIAKPFSEDAPHQLMTMRLSWEQHDLDVFHREANNLSGLLGTFNATPAQTIAEEIDQQLRNRNRENVSALFKKLETEVTALCAQLKAVKPR